MKLCSHCWSAAIGDTGGCRSIWLTAGPPARSFTASAAARRRRRGQAGEPARSRMPSDRCAIIVLLVSDRSGRIDGQACRRSAARSSSASAGAARAARSGRPRCACPRPRARSASGRRGRLDAHPAGAKSTCSVRRPSCSSTAGGPAQRQALAVGGVAGVDESAAPTASSSTRRTAGHASRRAPERPAMPSARRATGRRRAAARRDRAVALQRHAPSSPAGGAPEAPAPERRQAARAGTLAR